MMYSHLGLFGLSRFPQSKLRNSIDCWRALFSFIKRYLGRKDVNPMITDSWLQSCTHENVHTNEGTYFICISRKPFCTMTHLFSVPVCLLGQCFEELRYERLVREREYMCYIEIWRKRLCKETRVLNQCHVGNLCHVGISIRIRLFPG